MQGLNAAILGIGMTPTGIFPERTSVGLAADALQMALADADLERAAVDGLGWNLGRPSSEDYDTTAEALGLNLRFVNQTWTHGRFTGTSVLLAAAAVNSGLADYVACIGGIQRINGVAPAAYGVLPHGDLRPYGFGQFADEGAMALRRYLHLHGADPARLADVVVTLRRHAAMNPNALLKTPISHAEYMASPMFVDPLRTVDCFASNAAGVPHCDVGICVIIGRRNAVRKRERPGVYLLGGQGVRAGREETYFGRPGLGIFSQGATSFQPGPSDFRTYELTGVKPADIDGFYTYDAFSSVVWMALERHGHCPPGTAWQWATPERIAFDGSLPVNTNGGLIAEGHTGGWGHVIEMARQLRHEAGPRQIGDAAILQWATIFGDSFILTNDEKLLDRRPV